MSNSLPQVMAVSKVKMKKNPSNYLPFFQVFFHLTLFCCVHHHIFPLLFLFFCIPEFSTILTSHFLYNPASILNIKILLWQSRKLRIHGSLTAQSTTFSISVINLFLSIFTSRKTFWQKFCHTSKWNTKDCLRLLMVYKFIYPDISKSLKIMLSLISISIFSIVLP